MLYQISLAIAEIWRISAYFIFYSVLAIAFYFLTIYFFERENLKLKKIKKWPKVSIVVPCYNEEENIEKTLASLLKADYPKNKLEILVVDDDSKDKTYQIAKKIAKKHKQIKVFRKRHGGKADSVNYGIEKSKGQLVMVLDADTIPARNALKIMVREIMGSKKIMAVVPKLLPIKPKNVWEVLQDVEYRIMNFTRAMLHLKNCLNVTPAATLYKKEFFKKFGFFDKGNITEDLEMGLRILSTGHRVVFSRAKAYTKVPSSLNKLKRQRVRWSFGQIQNFLKYKHLFFSPKHGDLGNFYMPITFLSLIILSWFLVVSIIATVLNLINFFGNLSLVNFDLSYVFYSSLQFDFERMFVNLIDINNFIYTTSTFLTIATLVFTRKITEIRKKQIFAIIIFYVVYTWVLIWFYLIALTNYLLKKRVGW